MRNSVKESLGVDLSPALFKSFFTLCKATKQCFFPDGQVSIVIVDTVPCNRPFSYSESECGSNDISLQFVEFSNVHNCDRSSNATLSSLAYKIV